MTVSTTDLAIAWRKAKVDLYYSTNPPLFEMADYEDNLLENLEHLCDRINGDDEDWVVDSEFLGSWILVPKSINPADNEASKPDSGLIFASPDDEWTRMIEGDYKPTAEFRLMARCSMDLHVLSAYWMLKVGDRFDETLSDNVYGSRLRRNRYKKINEQALGSFKPYLKPFRDWRDGGIKAMSSALASKKKVLALTADVSSFYHELNPDFMLDDDFHKLAGVELKASDEKLHRLFITAIQAWAQNTPLKKGLPVGLPASAVIANAALLKMDQFIEQQVVPFYYGRYVDDIMLVMENTSGIKSTQKFWEWIFNRDGGIDLFKDEQGSILFCPPYLRGSRVAFENNKNKLFVLSGESGAALINAISEQINQRASEWRSLPNLPESAETVATDLLKATNHAGEQADNLRKTDALTLHRAGFALNLRDYEAYERDLPPDAWQQHRYAFYRAVIDHLLTPVKFFELAPYLSRIIRMATACEDFEYLGRLLEALASLVTKVEQQCELGIKASKKVPDDAFECWKTPLYESIAESFVSAWPSKLSREGKIAWEKFEATSGAGTIYESRLTASLDLRSFLQGYLDTTRVQNLNIEHARLFSYDLAHTPLRFAGLPTEMVSQRGIPARRQIRVIDPTGLLPGGIISGVEILGGWIRFKKNVPSGLVFSTRPFSLNELFLVARDPFKPTQWAQLNDVIYALRGFELTDHKMPQWDKSKRLLCVPDGDKRAKQTIAVSSWETKDSSFVAAVMRKPDPDVRKRFERINRLINELISRPDGASYLILPELALPPQWFMRISEKLKGRGISLITGVEYLHAPKKLVRNQIWASLTHDGLGFPSLMIYRQDKQFPALHEEQELFRLAGLEMAPAQSQKWDKPPIIQHGDFRFALMVCSELTNIRYRADLRGKIDALFVAEWNPDTDTFNALVESAALDIHAYIIQCNNRQFGDSRIRAPYKDRWKRDLLRVRGGNHDYCITGEIDILALRQFQSSHRSPSKGFKPVPDGFNEDMAHDRKELPKGE